MEQSIDEIFSEVDILFKQSKNLNKNKGFILSYTKEDLFKNIKNYSDVCYYLGIKELTISSFGFLLKEQRLKALSFYRIQNICKLFNQDWIPNWKNSKEKKWTPYYINNGSAWSFAGSFIFSDFSSGVAGFYQDQITSDFCGKLFIQEYINILEN